MSREEMIEQAARFACTARPGHDHQPRLDQECAWVLAVCENLADAGMLARSLPTRDEVRRVLEHEFWPFLAHSPNNPETFWGQATDAVLALMKGQDA